MHVPKAVLSLNTRKPFREHAESVGDAHHHVKLALDASRVKIQVVQNENRTVLSVAELAFSRMEVSVAFCGSAELPHAGADDSSGTKLALLHGISDHQRLAGAWHVAQNDTSQQIASPC